MNNVSAAKVLMSHLPKIVDGAYKTATEIAIETLIQDARKDWSKYYQDEMSFYTYLGLDMDAYKRWTLEIE